MAETQTTPEGKALFSVPTPHLAQYMTVINGLPALSTLSIREFEALISLFESPANPASSTLVLWAQRSSTIDPERNYIALTISAPDVSSPKINLTSSSLTFSGHSETKKTTYHVELTFYAEIDPEASKTHATSHSVTFRLRKKEMKEEYWPRLLKDDKRMHFLKTDFDKWVDEDEQDGAPDDDMPGGMGGMPDMSAMGGGDGGFGGLDFSKLGGGGAGGMPDMGDMGDMGGEGDDDDDEMPGLEDEDGKKAEAEKAGEKEASAQVDAESKGKGKIEEVE